MKKSSNALAGATHGVGVFLAAAFLAMVTPAGSAIAQGFGRVGVPNVGPPEVASARNTFSTDLVQGRPRSFR